MTKARKLISLVFTDSPETREWVFSFFTGYLGVLWVSLCPGPDLDCPKPGCRIAQGPYSSGCRDPRTCENVALQTQGQGQRIAGRAVGRRSTSLEERLKTVKRADNRLVVLDERRLPEDQPWILGISGPGGLLPKRRVMKATKLDRQHALPGLGDDTGSRD